jgi:mannose-1-phosphate guanylyltransferase
MKITAVIMAGGRGERFWPKSRNSNPKQFLSLTKDGETMIQKTVNRLLPLVEKEDIFIVTNESYIKIVNKQLPDIPQENILAEPCARNTAPCITLAAAVINRKYDDAVMLVLPSDHLIGYEELYIGTLKKAIKAANDGSNLVTIGITPTYPETGYGYINFSSKTSEAEPDAYKVARFVEKPDLETAKDYLASGKYLWNSGMFVWKASTILRYFERLLPDIYEKLMIIGATMGTASEYEVIHAIYDTIPKISIDYGIMERADSVYMLEGDFGWNDIGSFDALPALYETDENGNVVRGESILIGSSDNIIIGENKMIANSEPTMSTALLAILLKEFDNGTYLILITGSP